MKVASAILYISRKFINEIILNSHQLIYVPTADSSDDSDSVLTHVHVHNLCLEAYSVSNLIALHWNDVKAILWLNELHAILCFVFGAFWHLQQVFEWLRLK